MRRRPRRPKPDSPYPPGWEPFLAAIKADMDDDTPRLVFADWLEENGDSERAEFIRIQCHVHRIRHDDPTAKAMNERIEALLHTNWERWAVAFPSWLRRRWLRYEVVRGFVASVSMSGARFLKDGMAVARITPIQDLTLSHSTVKAMRSPTLSQIGGLSLEPVDSARLSALASNPDLSKLRSLFIGTGRDSRRRPASCHISRESVRRLLGNPTLAGLRQFILNGPALGDVVAAGLAAGQYVSLEQLDLYDSRLSTAGMKALVNSPSARSLRGLYLADNPMGDAGVRHLVEAPELRCIESLNLMNCRLSAESARLFAN
jgi:uncharacterized protein (TIGR02996 family)